MEFAFPWPVSTGEWLAWTAAAATVAIGLFAMFMPRLMLRLLKLQASSEVKEALAGPRVIIGGFYIGFGLVAILLAQPFIYLALGGAWAVATFSALVSMLSDGVRAFHSWIFLLLTATLAVMVLVYALGFVA